MIVESVAAHLPHARSSRSHPRSPAAEQGKHNVYRIQPHHVRKSRRRTRQQPPATTRILLTHWRSSQDHRAVHTTRSRSSRCGRGELRADGVGKTAARGCAEAIAHAVATSESRPHATADAKA